MKLHELSPDKGSTKDRYRKGRGPGSGNGKTSGKGHKGQNARSGGGVRPGFEGGQLPLYRRIPKAGFNNSRFATVYDVVNIKDLEKKFAEGAEVNPEVLADAGLVNRKSLVKVLGVGDLTKKLDVRAHKFSESAAEKIAAAGGKAEVI